MSYERKCGTDCHGRDEQKPEGIAETGFTLESHP